MLRVSRLVALGVAIFLVGLVVLFPARVAYSWLVPDGIRMSGISGTVWHGAADECRCGDLYLANLTWRFRPLALLTGKAGFSVTADPASGFVAGDFAVSAGGAVHLSDLSARLPIAAISGLAAFTGVDGVLDVDFETLVLEHGVPVRGSGTVEVAGLVARQLSSATLGTYQAEFRTVEDVLSGRIEDVSGVLDLDGTLELRPDRSYSLSGRIAATPAAPAVIVQQLGYLGAPDASGMRSFRFEGRL